MKSNLVKYLGVTLIIGLILIGCKKETTIYNPQNILVGNDNNINSGGGSCGEGAEDSVPGLLKLGLTVSKFFTMPSNTPLIQPRGLDTGDLLSSIRNNEDKLNTLDVFIFKHDTGELDVHASYDSNDINGNVNFVDDIRVSSGIRDVYL